MTLRCAQAKAWSRFFCLSVYVTMYLNDHSRSSFYESLGLDTTQFNRCGAFLPTSEFDHPLALAQRTASDSAPPHASTA